MLRRYFRLHLASLGGALGRVGRQPVASTLTILVIAIGLALPAGLKVIVDNASRLSASWQSVADITVYLDLDVTNESAKEILSVIDARDDVDEAVFIDREDALAEFKARSGFGSALDALSENPLPHTIVVSPAGGAQGSVEALAAALDEIEGTALVQLDTQWVARLRSMLSLVERIVAIATVLLAAAVVLVIGNTIRLEINNRSTEIEVMKLVGGTDGFIRRPFLYLGFAFGTIGAAIAALTITVTLALLRGPVSSLAELYATSFSVSGLAAADLIRLLGGGALLGFAGAWLAAARHLRAIEPS